MKKKSEGLPRKSAKGKNVKERRQSSRGRRRETSDAENGKRIAKNGSDSEISNENKGTRTVNNVIGIATPGITIKIVGIEIKNTAARRGKKFPRTSKKSYQKRTTSDWNRKLWLICFVKAARHRISNLRWKLTQHWPHHRGR